MKIASNNNIMFKALTDLFVKFDPVGLKDMVDDLGGEYSIEVECLFNTFKENQLESVDDVQDCLEFIIEEYFSMDVEIDVEFTKGVATVFGII